jgi:hypothetical protein
MERSNIVPELLREDELTYEIRIRKGRIPSHLKFADLQKGGEKEGKGKEVERKTLQHVSIL